MSQRILEQAVRAIKEHASTTILAQQLFGLEIIFQRFHPCELT